MKNKFEALKAFMNWPRDWQELCAEYWAEGDASVPVALQEGGVRFTARQVTPIYRGDFSIAEQEYLTRCHQETKTRRHAANMFLERFPGRTCQAVEIKIRKMLDANGVMHVRY